MGCWNPAEELESLEHGRLGLTVGLEPYGMGAGVPMAWILRSLGLRSGIQEHMDAGTSLELGPHRQSAPGTLGRHAGGTMKSDPKVPLWPEQLVCGVPQLLVEV